MLPLAALAAEQTTSDSAQAIGLALVVAMAVIGIALFAFFVTALVSVLGSAMLTGSGKILWALVVFVFPFLGPLVWFIWGRNQTIYRDPQPVTGTR